MTFISYGDPVDPAYIAFKTGLEKAVSDAGDRWRMRWNPQSKKWFGYPVAEWIFEDLNIPDTSPEGAVKKKATWPQPTYEVQRLYLNDLWDRLEKAARTHATQYPHLKLVWSPWGDGDWRNAVQRKSAPPPQPPPPRRPSLDPRVEEQITQIEAWRERGYISADQAQKMINAVLAAATPDA